ncbi:MAG: DUF1178 family protein [Qingshengfaniella sp.]
MIRYSLKCAQAHVFDSWFASADAFDALEQAGRLECPVCGSSEVQKSVMAPRVSGRDSVPQGSPAKERPLGPASPAEQFVAQLRKHVEQNSDHVGKDFAAEARRIHDGEAPQRSIHGEATAEDARSLIEDGIGVLPLPFRTGDKTN